MQTVAQTAPVSKAPLWTGRVLSALPVLMFLGSATMKLTHGAPVVQNMTHLGYSESVLMPLGIVELACTILYAVPRTAVLGAILLTAYLGGATATHVRVGEPFFMPIVIGVLLWLGLYLRDPALRAFVPLRRN